MTLVHTSKRAEGQGQISPSAAAADAVAFEPAGEGVVAEEATQQHVSEQ